MPLLFFLISQPIWRGRYHWLGPTTPEKWNQENHGENSRWFDTWTGSVHICRICPYRREATATSLWSKVFLSGYSKLAEEKGFMNGQLLMARPNIAQYVHWTKTSAHLLFEAPKFTTIDTTVKFCHKSSSSSLSSYAFPIFPNTVSHPRPPKGMQFRTGLPTLSKVFDARVKNIWHR